MDVFDLFAKISLDTGDYEKGLSSAKKTSSEYKSDVMKLAQTYKAQGMDMSDAMKKAYSEIDKSQYAFADNAKDAATKFSSSWDGAKGSIDGLAGKLKSGLATAAKVGAAAITAASAAVGFLVKNSVEAYGEYEQLVGGVETLFKTSADVVMGYAENAYKTAGLSANAYMETVTSFSASLLQSLNNDTAAAAEKADMAITDMADNANKMGTSMESIQNAYQGFAKQNYTMLDNLKLGYGGTKEEMERLLENATALSGVEYDVSSYADIVDAIHVVQTEMGITGTTAKEASTTIQGSISSMKAAWSNLVTGLADENADLDGLIGNLVDSAETAAANLIPVITQILSGMGTAIQQLAPIIADELPGMITSTLPSVISAGAQLLVGLTTGIVGAIPDLLASVPSIIDSFLQAISENQSAILEAGRTLLTFVGNGIMTGMPLLAEAAVSMMSNLGQYLEDNLPALLEAGLQAVSSFTSSLRENAGLVIDGAIGLAESLARGLADSIPAIVENVPMIVSNIANVINDNAPKILKAGVDIVVTLIKGIIDAIPTIIENIPKIVTAIVDVVTAFNWVNLGKKIIDFFAQGIKGMFSSVVEAAKGIITSITDGGGLKNLPQMALQWGKDLIDNFVNGIKNTIGKVKNAVSNVANTVRNFIGFSESKEGPLSNFHTYAPDMMKLFSEGITDNAGMVRDAIGGGLDFSTARVDFASSGLGASSAAVVNGMASAAGASSGGSWTVNLMFPDGTRLASYLLGPLSNYAKANGTPILNPA